MCCHSVKKRAKKGSDRRSGQSRSGKGGETLTTVEDGRTDTVGDAGDGGRRLKERAIGASTIVRSIPGPPGKQDLIRPTGWAESLMTGVALKLRHPKPPRPLRRDAIGGVAPYIAPGIGSVDGYGCVISAVGVTCH